MISVGAGEAMERALVRGLRFRSQPGAGGMTSVVQAVSDAGGCVARAQWSIAAILVVLMVLLVAGGSYCRAVDGASWRLRRSELRGEVAGTGATA